MSDDPYDQNLRRETPLALELRARIRRSGPIGIDDFMRACLHDPTHGYYRGKAAIGRAGDFITAPEISQVFGELIGLWCAVVWQQMGSPAGFDLIEIGPGRGTLMADALRATRIVGGFTQAARITLVETNATLQATQAKTLQAAHAAIDWRPDIPRLSRPAIVIANEFLDTAAIRQQEWTPDGWRERVVTLDDAGQLQFALGDAPSEKAPDTTDGTAAIDGAVREMRVDPLPDWLRTAALSGQPFAALLLDYGHTEGESGDTLQAVRRHRFEHPLASPGEADLSCQVDFAALAAVLRASLAIDGPITQAEFLGSLGITHRASKLMSANAAKANEIEMGVARLMNPQGMGGRFKAIGLRSADVAPLPGFHAG